uniref:BF3164 family lipoprotein n=1 Tax=Candidatus Cryptobacteroides bacterium TaxID=3085639 RepID=UPI003FF0F3BF
MASMRPDSKINFISVTSSDNYIYALYDGNMIQYYIEHKGEVPSGKYICVFDWDGNYVKCYQSRFPIRSLSWNPDDKNLYGCVLADDGEYRIYMFNSFR